MGGQDKQTRLDRLPPELAGEICSYLDTKAMTWLLQASRGLYHRVLPWLYRREISLSSKSVFAWACTHGRPETVELLLQYGLDPNGVAAVESIAPTPLERAASEGQVRIMELLLGYGADVQSTAGTSTALLEAIFGAAPERLKTAGFLLEHGADPNQAVDAWVATPLLGAVGKRDLGLIELLLEFGADINARGAPQFHQPLYRAIFYHEPEDQVVIEFLLAKGADPNASLGFLDPHPTPLARAVFECYYGKGRGVAVLDTIDILLSHGADINYTPPGVKQYPIHHAVKEIVPLGVLHHLLNCGADPNVGSAWTPLDAAMDLAVPPDRAEMLLAYDALPVPPRSSTGNVGSTPLSKLIHSHLSDGRVSRAWHSKRDWPKARVLMEYGGPELVAALAPTELAMLFSLTVSACRREQQMRRHVVNFARLVWMTLGELLELTREPQYMGIWNEESAKWWKAQSASLMLAELCRVRSRRRGSAGCRGGGSLGGSRGSGSGDLGLGGLGGLGSGGSGSGTQRTQGTQGTASTQGTVLCSRM